MAIQLNPEGLVTAERYTTSYVHIQIQRKLEPSIDILNRSHQPKCTHPCA